MIVRVLTVFIHICQRSVYHLSIGPAGGFGSSACNTAISLNEWVHVAAQQESGTHRYWINGVNAGESGGKPDPLGNADTSNVFIGTTAEGADSDRF